jgi:hypothetical protein
MDKHDTGYKYSLEEDTVTSGPAAFRASSMNASQQELPLVVTLIERLGAGRGSLT